MGAGVAVTEEFLGGKPVFEIATFGLTLFNPQQIGGMLNLRLGRLMQQDGFTFHSAGWVETDFRADHAAMLRRCWQGLRVSCAAGSGGKGQRITRTFTSAAVDAISVGGWRLANGAAEHAVEL
jgi:hypothetical protein